MPRLHQRDDALNRILRAPKPYYNQRDYDYEGLDLRIAEVLGRYGLAGGLDLLAGVILKRAAGRRRPHPWLAKSVLNVLERQQVDDPAVATFLGRLIDESPYLLFYDRPGSEPMNRRGLSYMRQLLFTVLKRQSSPAWDWFYRRHTFDGDGQLRMNVAEGLSKSRIPGRFEIIHAMRSTYERHNEGGAWVAYLAQTGDSRALDLVETYFRNHPKGETGLHLFMEFPGPEALPHLQRLLPGIKPGRERFQVLRRMAQHGDKDALHELVRELRNPDLETGLQAASQLSILFRRRFGYTTGANRWFPEMREYAIRQWERWRDAGWNPAFKHVPFDHDAWRRRNVR